MSVADGTAATGSFEKQPRCWNAFRSAEKQAGRSPPVLSGLQLRNPGSRLASRAGGRADFSGRRGVWSGGGYPFLSVRLDGAGEPQAPAGSSMGGLLKDLKDFATFPQQSF